ncbi:MAG: helix-turn-helix transcriptional regulator [Anaerolineae bacterium]|nr:helix-turn-helix transcriptional regulator [Anaerolineae bacterium]
MSTEDKKTRAQLLKQLREQYRDTVDRTQALLKEHNAVRKEIFKAMGDEPRTVPEIAELSGVSSHEVLWHITALKKYDLVAEVGMDGEYYQYQKVKGGAS